jgi:Flp pilus assembly protein CpaB
MARNRSSLLIAIGAAVFVVGTGLAFLAVRNGDDKPTPTVQAANTAPAAAQTGQTPAVNTALPSFEIPKGKLAVAVSLPYVQGMAGFVKPNDSVNLFGLIKAGSPAPKPGLVPPAAKLILSDVKVLYVSAPAAGSNATAAPASITYVLALTPAEGEQVVYFASFEGLYMSLARSDQGIVSTPGRTAGSAL